jgi:hypothetical protein
VPPHEPRADTSRSPDEEPQWCGGVYFKHSTGRWMGRYSTEDPETSLALRKAVYGRTEQEARVKLIKASASRQDGTLLVRRGRVADVPLHGFFV